MWLVGGIDGCGYQEVGVVLILVGPLEKNKNKNKNKKPKWRFFTSRGAHLNCAIMAMLYTHSIGNQP